MDQDLPPTLPPLEQNKTSFDPPQNWGAESQPSTDPVIASQTEALPAGRQESPPVEVESSPSVLKVILISLCLILLGVLLGVLAAMFYQPTGSSLTAPAKEQPEPIVGVMLPTVTPPLVIAPTATPEALLNLQWKNYSTKTYKLFYPQSWTKKNNSSGIVLTKGTDTISISSLKSDYSCNQPSLQNNVKGSYLWSIQMASASSLYQLCETKNSLTSPNTYIGTIIFQSSQENTTNLDEFKYLIEKIELIFPNESPNSTSSAIINGTGS